MSSVKVAVRVRPVNKRERDMGCKVCIKVDGKKMTISNNEVEGETKDFTYDHSYWSVESRDKHFASQEQVFSDLGMDVIDAAFQGYNACIFAYGQTGAGKSYSMMGVQDALGLIPRICESMYQRMSNEQAENNNKVEFKTEVSYLEIYNERVRDLLRPSSSKKGDVYNLKVREHPKEGPYVQDLTKHIVSKYNDIEKLMDMGNDHRTTASTNMNDTSSRSHAIFTINFTQAKFFSDMPSETVSKIHLVDLAGSERANSTGATGRRLQEGANINKSLVSLGNVISALAEASTHEKNQPKKKLFVPYRDSVLTWLLKDSLGGNAKTIMIAAISPADINYSETLSTLRYANRAKNIINKPTINEDQNVKLIRELREEIESLRLMLSNVSPNHTNHTAEEKNISEKLQKNEAQVEQLYRDWNNKWKETHKIMEEKALAFRREGFGIKMESDLPHLICIDDDILSTGVTLYHLNEGRTHVGREDARVKQDIVLRGPGIESEHCIFESIEGHVTIHPVANECSVNGTTVKKPLRLSQGCVILLGKTNMFRFNHPGEAAKLRQKYASVDNLASVVPVKDSEPSYLFYNAGMEMERRYHEEAKDLERKRREIEAKQELDSKRIEMARKELDHLQNERREAEDQQRKILEETERRLELQRKHLETLKREQDIAKENAQQELQELKLRIQQEHMTEKQKFDEEMQKMVMLNEMQQKSVKDQEDSLAKQKEEMEKALIAERQKIEEQRNEVVRLQTEYEKSRQAVSKNFDEDGNSAEVTDDRKRDMKAEELRSKLEELESAYEEVTKTAQREILQAKENLKKAEMETLQGKVGLMKGKTEIQRQWQLLEALQAKHKKIQEDIQQKIRDARKQVEEAEKLEEEELMNQEQSILERRQARKKVEEATQKLMEMESNFTRKDCENANPIQDLADWKDKEEVQEIQEQRKILMELLSKHQAALMKASQLVTETKTKLESHLQGEDNLIKPVRVHMESLEKELEPLIKDEEKIEKHCQELEREAKEKKKILYKQRKRINLLEKQHAQGSGTEGREGLSNEEIEDLDHDREAELELILREKAILHDMEEKFRKEQKQNELTIGEQYQKLESKKESIQIALEAERKKLSELVSVHEETREYIEAELNGRKEILKLSKEKVVKDKRELAKLDMKQQQTATKAAEELFMLAEVLEKELADSGKKEELAKIKDHRKKLQELDRQLRLAERRERIAGEEGADGNQQCVIL